GLSATAERKYHSDVDETGGVSRVITTVQTLLRRSRITEAQAAAAERWRVDYVFFNFGVGDQDPLLRCGISGDQESFQLARVGAGEALRGARAAIGRAGEQRLILMLVEELPFARIGDLLFPGSPTGCRQASAQIALVLEVLADHYYEADRVS
ncbi:hypothetical protein, partial [Acetobacter oeni]